MSGYKAVDFDGTLAEHDPGSGVDTLGVPIPGMVKLVKQWLAEDIEVRILTARVSPEWGDRMNQALLIQDWCEKHLGQRLAVQAHKCGSMWELWDDRAVGVVRNTGLRADEVAVDNAVGKILTWLENELQTSTDPTSRSAFDYVQREIARGAWK